MDGRIYVIGQSGSGKSTLLEQFALADEGFIFLDPHGDSALKLADTIDCILWEPPNVGFNPLKDIPFGQRHLVADNVTLSFKNIFAESWGPRLEWILYNAVLLLIDNNASLIQLPLLLTDSAYRARCLKKASYRNFWLNEFEKWEPRQRNEAIAPVLNKIGPLVVNPVIRETLSRNTISLKRVMDGRQKLVVNLSKGQLGEQASHLLGALLVSAIAYTAQGRATLPYPDRVPFTLYADEFQNFATDSFSVVLSEARKYRLSICVGHQFLGQIPDRLRQSVFGNVNRFISFKVGAEDAPAIADELGLPNPERLTDLAPFEYLERQGLETILKRTLPPAPSRSRLEAVRKRTKARYS